MARAGLGSHWQCLLANDIDPKKANAYISNWGKDDLRVCDVADISTRDIPTQADLAWASFPCQDLSLAGSGAGLGGERSSCFWPFWNLIDLLTEEGRQPQTVVLENVCGALTSHNGKDFASICDALVESGYKFGALVIDAVEFVPQSRPRLFIIGVQKDNPNIELVEAHSPNSKYHSAALVDAHNKLSKKSKDSWVWWNLPSPALRNTRLSDLIESNPESVKWHSAEETQKLISMMSPINLEKLKVAKKAKTLKVGTVYKRTRPDGNGGTVQRAEVRFDEVAGCLRTPAGGSSRQTILVVEGNKVRSRLLSTREAARLMGLGDSYKLPERYNEAYHLAGDGVAVPVVRHIAENILEPLIGWQVSRSEKAA